LGCAGCLARDTWDSTHAPTQPVTDVAQLLSDVFCADPTLTGLTISGGEPSEQADAIGSLLVELAQLLRDREPEVDVLLYSGLSQRRLFAEFPDLVAGVDAVIPEPFVAMRAPGGRWRGSSNQPLVLITDLARERYAGIDLEESAGLQLIVTDGDLWVAGVPLPGALDAMVAEAGARGVSVGKGSWRP
jgi:anaerobic ribonucleoside-triphosphate reductase activating protein